MTPGAPTPRLETVRPRRRDTSGGTLAGLVEVACPSTGRSLRLRRAWPRGTGHLLLEYVELDGSKGAVATVAAQWFADRGRLATVARQTAAVCPAQVTTIGDTGLLLQRGGADRRLRALSGLLADSDSVLIVHRPERRAVVRRSGQAPTTYLKLVRPDRLATHLNAMRLDGQARFRTPVVVAADASTGTIECTALAGRSLHGLLGETGVSGAASAAFRAAGAAVRELHGSAPPAGVGRHDALAEGEVVDRWIGHALVHGMFTVAQAVVARSALADVQSRLARLVPPTSSSLIHRDLHDKQILVDDDGGVGLLDLDTLAIGDPALDVANLLAHLELRVLQGQGSLDGARVAADAFLEGYRPAPELMERVVTYVATSRLRLACVYAFRPRWTDLAGRLLGVEGTPMHRWVPDEPGLVFETALDG